MDRIAPLTARLVVRAPIPQLLTRPVALVVTVAVAVTVAEVRVITKLLHWVVAVLVVLLAQVAQLAWLLGLASLSALVLLVTIGVVLLVRLALVVMLPAHRVNMYSKALQVSRSIFCLFFFSVAVVVLLC